MLLEILKDNQLKMKVFATLHFSFGVEKRKEDWQLYEGMFVLGPLQRGKLGVETGGSHAAFMYDAINLVIHAIRQVGTEREAITDYISGSSYPGGATGSISFDELGNRLNAATLYQVKNGDLQEIN